MSNEIHTTLTHRYFTTIDWMLFYRFMFCTFHLDVDRCFDLLNSNLFLFSLLRLPHVVFSLISSGSWNAFSIDCTERFFISLFAWYQQADLQSAEEEKRRRKRIVNYFIYHDYTHMVSSWRSMRMRCSLLVADYVADCICFFLPFKRSTSLTLLLALGFLFLYYASHFALPIWCNSLTTDLCCPRRIIGHFCNGDQMTQANGLFSRSEISCGEQWK